MATITLNIPTTAATRFVKAIGYSATLPDGTANPIDATTAAKQWIINDIKAAIIAYESPTISQTAINTNITDVNNNIIIT